jgi:hypothetical protein
VTLPASAGPPRRSPGPAPTLLAIALVVFTFGMATREHYGTTWDEAESYEAGKRNLAIVSALVAGEIESVDAIEWPWHEVTGHQLVLDISRAAVASVLDRWVGTREAPAERVFNLALTAASLALVGALVVEVTASLPLGAAAAVALALQPKLLAHAQNNPKDLPGLFVFTLGVLALVRLAQRPGVARAALAAAALGLATTTWLPAVALAPIAVVILIAWTPVASSSPRRAGISPGSPAVQEAPAGAGGGEAPRPAVGVTKRLRRHAALAAAVLAGMALSTLALWPWLWPDPVGRLRQVADRLAEFPTGFEVLYFGRLYPSDSLPWHYTAGSLVVATPIAMLALAALGAAGAVPRGGDSARRRLARLAIGWLASLLALDATASFHYDGVRHVLAALPALAILAALGGERVYAVLLVAMRSAAPRARARSGHPHEVTATRRAPALATALLTIPAALLVVDLARLHPYHDAFVAWPFRRIAPGATERVFELEYWGQSYRSVARWLNAHAEPDATVLAPIAPHCLEPHLRPDLVVRERMRRSAAAEARPYVVFMTRLAWYAPLGLDQIAASEQPLHVERVPFGALAVVYRPRQLPPALTRPGGPRSWRPPRTTRAGASSEALTTSRE